MKLYLAFVLSFLAALSVHAAPLPATPTVSATGTAHSTSFSWTAATQPTGVTVAGYNLYCASVSGGESASTVPVNGAALIVGTSYTDTAVTQGTTQFCVVTSDTAAGAQQSAFSNEVSFTTPSNPNPPTLSAPVVALNVTGNRETVVATWTDIPGRDVAYVIWNGTNILAQGVVKDPKNTGAYSVTWNGRTQPTYVQVFDVSKADQPVS